MSTPHEIASLRLANGEIGPEEYHRILGGLAPPPGGGVGALAAAPTKRYLWYDPSQVLGAFRTIVIVYCVFHLVGLLVLLGGSADDLRAYFAFDLGASGSLPRVLLVVSLLIDLLACVGIALCLYRFASNVASVGLHKPYCTPGWAVGWFFVPVAGAWMPYIAQSFVTRASLHGRAWERHAPPGALTMWFLLYLAAFLLGMSLAEVDAEAIIVLGVVTFVVAVMSLLCLLHVLTRVAAAQTAWTSAGVP